MHRRCARRSRALLGRDVKTRFAMAQGYETYPPLPPQHLAFNDAEFSGRLKPYPQVLPEFSSPGHTLPDVAVNRQAEMPLQALQDFQAVFQGRILLCAESPAGAKPCSALCSSTA